MILRVATPAETIVDERARKIVAEDGNGSFCILPRHIDLVTALVPGILSFEPERGGEALLAVDGGILVKCGEEVLLSTMNAVRSPDLEQLHRTLEQAFLDRDELKRKTRTALARLEAGFVNRFLKVEQHGAR